MYCRVTVFFSGDINKTLKLALAFCVCVRALLFMNFFVVCTLKLR